MQAIPFFESGNLAVKLGPNPPAILVDAIAVYRQAREATRAENERLIAENAKKKPR